MISNEKGRPNNGGNAQKYRLLCARVFWKDLLLLDAARSRSGRQGECRAGVSLSFSLYTGYNKCKKYPQLTRRTRSAGGNAT